MQSYTKKNAATPPTEEMLYILKPQTVLLIRNISSTLESFLNYFVSKECLQCLSPCQGMQDLSKGYSIAESAALMLYSYSTALLSTGTVATVLHLFKE